MSAEKKALRILGIDFGLAKIGLSLSDERQIFASPAGILNATKKMEKTILLVIQEIQKLQEKWDCLISGIVIGLPLKMGGGYSFMTDEALHFAAELQKAVPTILVQTWDERLTSVQAERMLLEAGLTRKKRSHVIDTVAAVIILQGYLDRRNFQKEKAKLDLE